MTEHREAIRSRQLKGGKILFNNRQSVISCTLRNLSTGGAKLTVETAIGVPAFFDLLVEGDAAPLPCHVIWKAQNNIGVAFQHAGAPSSPAAPQAEGSPAATPMAASTAVRSDLLSLRAALDEVPMGIVLLDGTLRAQIINKAFRAMWRLPAATAESRPAFVTLMYHGRDTRAYEVPDDDLDAYVETRVAHVRAGDPAPINLRLSNGDIIRFQCTKLPDGGRMLSYTDVTGIVRRADELERLRAALDTMEQGIILLDDKLSVEFMNVAVRRHWRLPDAPSGTLSFPDLVRNARISKAFGMSGEALDIYLAQRIARVRAGDPRPMDIRHEDGSIVRCHCSVLPNGGRMLSYVDVTDLVRHTDQVCKVTTGF
jgi:PAS domain-containing protein